MSEYKQVLVIRKDLMLSKGKTAAQAAHASLCSVMKARKKVRELWEAEGQKKVVLSAGLEEIKAMNKKCREKGIVCSLIRDAGLTELKSGTITALGIGPDKGEKIDKITGSLPLLK